MLYRTMLDDEYTDIKNTQYMPNPVEQYQKEPQYMGYPIMEEMFDPSTYGFQMPQNQYKIPEENDEDMRRAPNNNHDYNEGYYHGYNQGYNHGYNLVFNQYPIFNNYNYNPFFPAFPLLPLILNRD